MTAWEAAGWKTPPRNGREWKRLRAGGREPVRQVWRDGHVPPCRVCRGRVFSLAMSSDGKGGHALYRKCLRCLRRRAKSRRADPVRGPKLREQQRTWAAAKRALARQEVVDVA